MLNLMPAVLTLREPLGRGPLGEVTPCFHYVNCDDRFGHVLCWPKKPVHEREMVRRESEREPSTHSLLACFGISRWVCSASIRMVVDCSVPFPLCCLFVVKNVLSLHSPWVHFIKVSFTYFNHNFDLLLSLLFLKSFVSKFAIMVIPYVLFQFACIFWSMEMKYLLA